MRSHRRAIRWRQPVEIMNYKYFSTFLNRNKEMLKKNIENQTKHRIFIFTASLR